MSKWWGMTWSDESPSTYDSDNDKRDPRWCVDHVPIDTGFGSSYCKRCDTSLEFIDFQWIPTKRNKEWRKEKL